VEFFERRIEGHDCVHAHAEPDNASKAGGRGARIPFVDDGRPLCDAILDDRAPVRRRTMAIVTEERVL
jgi:hypothetical protein